MSIVKVKYFSESLVDQASRISPELGTRISELLGLEAGGDGEDARPVKSEVIGDSLELLGFIRQSPAQFRIPTLGSTLDGYVMLHWTKPGRMLEVQAEPRGWSVVGTLTSVGGEKQYLRAGENLGLPEVLSFYEWFAGELPAWPKI